MYHKDHTRTRRKKKEITELQVFMYIYSMTTRYEKEMLDSLTKKENEH
jgi:hypothetical protein